MLVVCWSPKGGSGTSVVAAGLALSHRPSLLVDLDGDQPAILGRPSDGVGLCDWLAALPETSDEALGRLEDQIADRCSLLGWGEGSPPGSGSEADAAVLGGALADDHRLVVVDAGRAESPFTRSLREAADVSLCVLRPCYLAVTRAVAAPRPGAVVLVDEPGRALNRADVAAALDVAVDIVVPWDPAIARAVDAGVLAQRQPRVLHRPLSRWSERLDV